MKTQMQLVKLTVEKVPTWRDQNPGRYVATVEYESPKGQITMPLSPEISEQLLAVLGPMIARFGSDAATEIATCVLQAVEDIKHPAIEQLSSSGSAA